MYLLIVINDTISYENQHVNVMHMWELHMLNCVNPTFKICTDKQPYIN